MVEIGHDDNEAVVFFAEEVVDRDFDVVKLNICCCGGGGVGCLDAFRFYIVGFGDHDYGEAFRCLATGHEVICEHAYRRKMR